LVQPGTDPQSAYRIQVSHDADFRELIADSGICTGDVQVAVPAPGGSFVSREVRFVRVSTRHGDRWSAWSDALRVEAGLLLAKDWIAEAITLPGDPGEHRPSPVPMLRRQFLISGDVRSARLHVSALGIHHTMVNGMPVSADVLGPGWTPYDKRLLADTYDVTELLQPGENVIASLVGDGWYRGRLGWAGHDKRAWYGTQVGLIAQLEVELADGSRSTVASDASWRASTGELLAADLYDGCTIDLRLAQPGWQQPGFDDRAWSAAAIVPMSRGQLVPRTAPATRHVGVIRPRRQDRDARVVLDGGQNISGWVRLRVRGRAGDLVEVRHAEVLEPDGGLHVRSLRTARATDTYTLAADGEATIEPMFTFHGFQFAEVSTGALVLDAEFIAITSAWIDRGRFECSVPALNRLHENVVWSLRDNFVSVPTDCPQRDERLGWTGDAQVFAATACTMFWSEALWRSWLRDLELEQDHVLGVPSVVPNVVLRGAPEYGRAGWGDAATIVPWAVYESYGDVSVLAAQIDSMERWVRSLDARRRHDGLIGVEMQFGDWLDPTAPTERPWDAATNAEFVANAYLVHSARLLARAATLLRREDLAAYATRLADTVASITWERWAEHAVTTQTGCAIALELGIAPQAMRRQVAAALAALVHKAGGHVATGFLGTPLVLSALSSEDQFDAAYEMLLCRTYPSWLYQVEQGATTIWERWDAIRPDGSIHPGDMRTLPETVGGEVYESHMLSFNHYAYGAVMDWVYRHVAGIAPTPEAPGYRRILFSPVPTASIARATATIETAYGPASISWRVDGQFFDADVVVPPGATGQFRAPAGPESIVTHNGAPSSQDLDLETGRHTIHVARPVVCGR
jgi:alpha-L-rhamnosidase